MKKQNYQNLEEERTTELPPYNDNIPIGQPVNPYAQAPQHYQPQFQQPPHIQPQQMQPVVMQQALPPPPAPIGYTFFDLECKPITTQPWWTVHAVKCRWPRWLTWNQEIPLICGVLSLEFALLHSAVYLSSWTPALINLIIAPIADITSSANIKNALNSWDADWLITYHTYLYLHIKTINNLRPFKIPITMTNMSELTFSLLPSSLFSNLRMIVVEELIMIVHFEDQEGWIRG